MHEHERAQSDASRVVPGRNGVFPADDDLERRCDGAQRSARPSALSRQSGDVAISAAAERGAGGRLVQDAAAGAAEQKA